jgi:hypothetical protein
LSSLVVVVATLAVVAQVVFLRCQRPDFRLAQYR